MNAEIETEQKIAQPKKPKEKMLHVEIPIDLHTDVKFEAFRQGKKLREYVIERLRWATPQRTPSSHNQQ